MTDADSIWTGKLSRLQDPNLEKMKPLVELMGELRERRQERGQPLSHAPGAQEGKQHQQAPRPTEGVEHDASTRREWTKDVEGRRPWWWRRWFGG